MSAPKSANKTEPLSVRLDPKTRFVLEFVARVNGQSITTAVERAIKDFATSTTIGGGHEGEPRNWSDYWDAEEGVRLLRMWTDPSYPTTFEEDQVISFCKAHWEFFFYRQIDGDVIRHNVEILYPNIQSYLEMWRSKKREDYWAAGREMKRALESAKISSPDWPRKAASGKPTVRETFSADLDDEIPF